MKFSVSPVVRVAISPKKQEDLPKLIEALRKLENFDPMVQCIVEENTHQYIICGCGELHVEICIKILEDYFFKAPIQVDKPIVTYKETVTLENPG